LVLALGDLILVHAGYLGAFLIRFGGVLPDANFQAYLQSAPGLTLLALGLFLSYGLYDLRPQSWRTAASGVAASSTLLLFLGMALSFVVRTFALPRSVFLLSWALHVLSLFLWRNAVWQVAQRVWGPEKVMVAGPTGEVEEFARRLASGKPVGWEVVAALAGRPPQAAQEWLSELAAAAEAPEAARAPVEEGNALAGGGRASPLSAVSGFGKERHDIPLLPLASLASFLEGEGIPPPDVIILTPSISVEDKARVVALSSRFGVRVLVVPGHQDLLVLDSRMAQIDDILAFEVGPTGVPGHLAWAKRLMDISFALLGLILTLPWYPFIALAVKLSSPGPVFYCQTRVGLGGRPYTLWKFRTMRVDAEAETGPTLSGRDDPRVTRVGRLLRRFRLDELPQLFNVLMGSMSLVGPRPERPEFVRKYSRTIPYYDHRHLLKPGLTGLAQLYARYDTAVEEKLRYDLLYAKRYSLLLDLRIILLTLRTLLKGDEAHWRGPHS
jgi:lipopolysaccharide/colanic/teichoic acid biosynthesis glycosyltransferase